MLVLSSGAGAFTEPCYPRPPEPFGALISRARSPSAAWPPSIPAHAPAPALTDRVSAARHGPSAQHPYLNRELSWLEFNARVLHEARDARNPLLERVKFLAIFAEQPRRVLPGPDRRPAPAGRGRQRRTVARRPDRRRSSSPPHATGSSSSSPITRAIYVDVRRELAAEGRRARRLRGDPGAPRRAAPALPRRDLPGPDAAGGRSRATRSRTSRR